MMTERDDFSKQTINAIQRRAAFLCSNPECRCLTIAPVESIADKWVYIGYVAHISAAAKGGPRYDHSLTPEQRSNISNAIFLCASCATLIDKNKGADYPADLLKKWKTDHESWVKENLNKKPVTITEVAGTHEAYGVGDIAGLRISKPTNIQPGTIARGGGIGKVSGTSIE
jgi:hypothetical protein